MSFLKGEYRRLIDLFCKRNNKVKAQDILESSQTPKLKSERNMVNFAKILRKYWRK